MAISITPPMTFILLPRIFPTKLPKWKPKYERENVTTPITIIGITIADWRKAKLKPTIKASIRARAIIAFVVGEPQILRLSINFTVFGMIDMLYTWNNSYSLLSSLRKSSHVLGGLRKRTNDLVKATIASQKSYDEVLAKLKQRCERQGDDKKLK